MSIRLFNSSGGYIDLESGGTSAAANVFTLPAETGTILTSATTSGINASALSAGTLAKARLPAGSVLQVVQATTTTRTVGLSTSYVDISGLSASITPASASNKILVMFCLSGGTYRGGSNGNEDTIYSRVMRNSTEVSVLYAYDARVAPWNTESNVYALTSGQYLDSPSTSSSTTYKIQIKSNTGNRGYDISPSSTVSTITLMEIAG